MLKYNSYLIALLLFFLSGLVSSYEIQEVYLSGIVHCKGKSCPKVFVYYNLNQEVISDQTKEDGSFLLPYSGEIGDEVIIFFEKQIDSEENCYAKPITYKIRSLWFFERWMMSRPKLRIEKRPILMGCEKGDPIQVKN